MGVVAMRKHLFGFTLFSLIVGSAVMIYPLVRSYEIPTVPLEINMGNDKKYACDYMNERISYRIVSAEFDVNTGKFTSLIEIKWNESSLPPETVYMSLFLLENLQDPEKLTIAPNVLEQPFENGNRFIATVSISQKTARKFRDWNNIYAYVDFAKDGKFPSTHEERLLKYELIPVLKIH
jgi:hypothetical protein